MCVWGGTKYFLETSTHTCWWSINVNLMECVELTYTASSYLWVVAFL